MSISSEMNTVNKQGLSYRDPINGLLLNTAGSSWEYQASDELKQKLRNHIYRHHHCFSRNAKEFHKLAAQCFDGTYAFGGLKFQYQEENEVQHIVKCLESPYVFHVSLENGAGLRTSENAWTGIGFRMLLQLLPEYEGK
ncbi:hypothetical protein V8E54_005719 [Elaphomyces granulatus]